MRKLASNKWLLFVAAGVVGLVGAFAQTIEWVGQTDVEVRFVVTNAEAGQPIPNAAVHITAAESGGCCDDAPQPEFTITTDQSGFAEYRATNCLCFGSKGPFKDTFTSHLPQWSFHVTAAGFFATDPEYLSARENVSRVQRGGSFATLSVPVRLRKID